MRRIVFGFLAALFLAAPCGAQTYSGNLPAWNVFANPSASAARGRSATFTQMLDGAFCTTTNAFLLRGASVWACQSLLPAASGGTGVNNGTSTITLAASLVTTGAGAATLAFPASPATYTYPGATATLASLTTADQTLSGGANVTSFSIGTVSTGTTTIDCGKGPLQFLTNGGSFTLAAPAADGSCVVQIINNASAGSVIFSGFTTNSLYVGGALTTTNTNKFMVSITRINGSSIYNVIPQQ